MSVLSIAVVNGDAIQDFPPRLAIKLPVIVAVEIVSCLSGEVPHEQHRETAVLEDIGKRAGRPEAVRVGARESLRGLDEPRRFAALVAFQLHEEQIAEVRAGRGDHFDELARVRAGVIEDKLVNPRRADWRCRDRRRRFAAPGRGGERAHSATKRSIGPHQEHGHEC